MTGTPTILLVALAMLVAIGCESTAKWETLAEADGRWQVWTDEAGNQYRRTLLRYPNGRMTRTRIQRLYRRLIRRTKAHAWPCVSFEHSNPRRHT